MKKKKEDNIYDFKKWNVPTRWDEINLKTWSKIQQLYTENEDSSLDIIELVSILCNKDREMVQQLPTQFLDTILTHLQFLYVKPSVEQSRPYIEIDGERYEANIVEKLKAGEYIDINTILKDDKYNYAMILAILCRKKDEVYNDTFIAEKLKDRIKMFENIPITEAFPVISFFLNLWLTSETYSILYTQTEEGINDIANNIKTLRKNGEISRRSMKSVMTTLQKLKKQLKSI